MTDEGKDVTDPMLDVNDFIGEVVRDSAGRKIVSGFPTSESANLY